MNNIYKVIWSKAKNCYVVASEIARSHTKSATGSGKIGGVTRRSLLASLMALSLLCGGLGVASAADVVHVDENATGATEVYTKTGVDALLDKKADKTAVEEIKNTVGGVDSGLVKKTNDNATGIEVNKTNIKTLQDNVGDDTKGLTKKINDNTAAIAKKADTAAVTTLEGRVEGVEGKVTTLETTVGDASNGLVRDVNELKTQGNNLNNALGNKADLSDLEDATKRITVNEGNITELQTKTQKINHDVANDTTSVNGMKVGQKQVDMNGKNLTGVGTINGIDLGTKEGGKYISQDGSIWGNMKKVDTQVETNQKNIETNKTAITELDTKVGKVGTGTYLDPNKTVCDNLGLLDAGLKQEVADRKAAIGELAVNGNYIEKDKNVSDNLVKLDNQAKANAGAITETNQRTHGITRDDTRKETKIEGKVTVDTNGNITAEGTITSNGLNARDGDITTNGKVSAGDVSTGTLETTGTATIGGDLTVDGKLKVGEIYMEHKKQESTGEKYDSATSITADGISNAAKVTDRNGVTTESTFTHDKEGSTTYAYQGDAANWKKSTSNVTADGVENVAEDSKGNNNTFTQTSTETKNTLTDKEGNTSSTRQDSKGIYGYAKDKDGNKSYTKQEGNRIAESVIGQDGKETKSEMTSTNITNTAKDGTITNTAKNVTNEGTESVTNKVGNNEVKVSQNGVDITAEAGKKITESVGTASRVVENAKITDNAGDSTVTTEKDKGTTFGKAGSTGTTNIYGDSIKTGRINAEDTTTGKLTAGAAADANGGRLTVDANDGVKGSYKSDKYTSKSYILANTLKSGVDNGKEPTEDGFVGSRTDHYMDGDKAKLDETVKDAAGSNVTNKTSTGTVTTITDGTTSTVIKQDKDNVTIASSAGTVGIAGKDIINAATDTITNTAGTKITDTAGDSSVTTENGKGTTFTNTGANTAIGEGTVTDTTIKGNTITTGKVTMDYAEVMKDLGVTGKTTTGSLEVKGESKLTGNVTMENNATVGNDLTVKGITNTKTLNVTEDAKVGRNLAVDGNATIAGDVTARSYNVGDKTYIDADGIHANNQKITDVADGSISEGSKDAVNGGQLYNVKNDLEGKVNKVGANAAAMANLHPMEFDPDSKWNIAAAIGNYGSETAAALGAFYRPNDDVMVNLSTAFGTGENMVGGGVSVRLGKGGNKLSREENNALKDQVNDLTARMDALLSVLNPNMSKDFPDVPENHWAYEAVSRLAGNDIVQGYPDGEFHGERTMTRYEMAEIIYNALSRGAEAEKELVEEFKPELQAMAASEKATAERAEG